MAKMQIPLNGSNFVSENRQQAFKDALTDDYQINCEDEPRLQVEAKETIRQNLAALPTQMGSANPGEQQPPTQTFSGTGGNFDRALDHTYKHQQRMMEIHQQYLAQQAEYIQLITAVLDQQGKALNVKDERSAAGMIETFQRTLDNFHAIREQGLQVHREFLIHQASFSEHYLNALEQGNFSPPSTQTQSVPDQSSQVTEWVVTHPPIVLDDHSKNEETPLIEEAPVKLLPQKGRIEEEKQTGVSTEELTKGLLEIVAEKTGYPSEMLDLDMDLEADLGIDSIKRVEILGSLEEKYPSLPPADTEVLSQTRTIQEIINYMEAETGQPAAPHQKQDPDPPASVPQELSKAPETTPNEGVSGGLTLSTSDLADILLDIVAEKTGYPADMLDQDMDMEADLGIDSIKRVEILGAMEERVPGLPPVEAEQLAELRTLGEIVELIGAHKHSSVPQKKTEAAVKKKDEPVNIENTPVKLISLPEPDRLDFSIPENRPVIITSDGTELTLNLQAALTDRGWKTIIWEFPEELIAEGLVEAPPEITIFKQTSLGKNGIGQSLKQIRNKYGKPSGFIHLHPPGQTDGLVSDRDERIIKEVFFLAGSLHDDLNQTDPAERNIFLSINRADGTLGFENLDSFQEGLGLAGLVKSLAREWPEVFCRFIDFSLALDESDICGLLLSEIHDPQRTLHEIGLSPGKRMTIERDYES